MFDANFPGLIIVRFIDVHSHSMRNACQLLGGPKWLRIADDTIEEIQFTGRVTTKSIRRLFDILGLLRLENVHDFSRIESAYFMMVDPTQPYIDEICLLTEALEDALSASGAEPNGRIVTGKA